MEYQHSHCISQAPSYLSEVLFMFCVLHHDIYHTYIIVDHSQAPHWTTSMSRFLRVVVMSDTHNKHQQLEVPLLNNFM